MRHGSTLPACLASVLPVLMMLVSACGAFVLPSLEEQKARIQRDEIRFHTLTSAAFLDTWGIPTYEHQEQMQFFPVESGNFIPRFRTPPGEPPPGWDSTVVSGEARFLGYADRGELLGFLEDRLVYREQLPSETIHAIGKLWKREELFKTRVEREPLSLQ